MGSKTFVWLSQETNFGNLKQEELNMAKKKQL